MHRHFPPWIYGEAPLEQAEAVKYINHRLKDLERRLEFLTRAASHGPFLGAYFPLVFHRYKGSAFTGGDETVAIRTNFDITPLYFTAHTDVESLTCQLRDGTTDLLGADLDTAAADPWVNTHSGFTVDHIAKQASLRVRVTGVTGAPTVLHALLIGVQVQKVDSPQDVL